MSQQLRQNILKGRSVVELVGIAQDAMGIEINDIESRVESILDGLMRHEGNPVSYLQEHTSIVFGYPEEHGQGVVSVGFMLKDLSEDEINRINMDGSTFYPAVIDSRHVVAWSDLTIDDLHLACNVSDVAFTNRYKHLVISNLQLPEWYTDLIYSFSDEDFPYNPDSFIARAVMNDAGAIPLVDFPQTERMPFSMWDSATTFHNAVYNNACRVFLEAEDDKYILGLNGIVHVDYPQAEIVAYPNLGAVINTYNLSCIALSVSGTYYESVTEACTRMISPLLHTAQKQLEAIR